jgi:hypothetical protein
METLAVPSKRSWRPIVTDGLAILLIGLAAFKLAYHSSKVRDLGVCDEVTYMWLGSQIPTAGLPAAEACPLYCMWYFGLSVLQPDRVHLFSLNWSLLSFLLPVSLYALVRATGGSRTGGLIAAALVLLSRVVDHDPFPSHLAAVGLMLGTAAAATVRRTPWSLAILGSAILLSAYIRPEYSISFLLFCAAALASLAWETIRNPRSLIHWLGPVLLVIFLLAGLLRGIGNPLAGGRSFFAFAQHYAYNLARNHKLETDINPWIHWQSIARQNFGDAESVGGAWRANPRAVLWHIGQNAVEAPQTISAMASPRFISWEKVNGPPFENPAILVCLAGAVLGAVGLVIRLRRSGAEEQSQKRRLLLGLLMVALLSIPTVASALVVFPRLHYLMPTFLIVSALVVANLAYLPAWRLVSTRLNSMPAVAAVGAVIIAVIPNLAHGWDVQYLLQGPPPPPLNVPVERTIVSTLKSLKIRGPVVVLDTAANTHTFYAGLSGEIAWPWEKRSSFWTFVRGRKINLIVLHPTLLIDVAFRDDPEFQAFISGLRTEDFVIFPVPKTAVRIAVQKDLLPAAP